MSDWTSQQFFTAASENFLIQKIKWCICATGWLHSRNLCISNECRKWFFFTSEVKLFLLSSLMEQIWPQKSKREPLHTLLLTDTEHCFWVCECLCKCDNDGDKIWFPMNSSYISAQTSPWSIIYRKKADVDPLCCNLIQMTTVCKKKKKRIIDQIERARTCLSLENRLKSVLTQLIIILHSWCQSSQGSKRRAEQKNKWQSNSPLWKREK